MGEPVYVVFNPHSGKGRGARLIEPVLTALRSHGQVEHGLTREAGDETRLTLEAVGRGFRKIVAVGGDGTWSHVGNAILGSGRPDVSLGVVPGGTGCDLAKSLGVPARDLGACASIIHNGHVRTIDVGRVEGRYFLNVLGFGFDIAVLEDSWGVRYFRGDLLYLYCALRQIWRFPGLAVEEGADGHAATRREVLMFVIANGRVFGGGFQIAPRGSLDDGQLDAVEFRNMSVWRRLRIMGLLMKGRHESAPEVTVAQGRRFDLHFDAPPAYETDGEWNRAASTDLRVEALPGALRVLAPAPA